MTDVKVRIRHERKVVSAFGVGITRYDNEYLVADLSDDDIKALRLLMSKGGRDR